MAYISVPLFSYTCTGGFCTPAYGNAYYGTSEDVAKACSNDHPNCTAYQYSASKGYGHLCTSVANGGSSGDYINCIKSEGTIIYSIACDVYRTLNCLIIFHTND